MLKTRAVTVADAALITAHRESMLIALGRGTESILAVARRNHEPWITRMIAGDRYAGWITCDGDRPVASAGLLILDWPPTVLDPEGELRGYLLNVFVEPEYRRRGLARALVNLCLAEARRRRIGVVALHCNDAIEPFYESLGFRRSHEMQRVEASGE